MVRKKLAFTYARKEKNHQYSVGGCGGDGIVVHGGVSYYPAILLIPLHTHTA